MGRRPLPEHPIVETPPCGSPSQTAATPPTPAIGSPSRTAATPRTPAIGSPPRTAATPRTPAMEDFGTPYIPSTLDSHDKEKRGSVLVVSVEEHDREQCSVFESSGVDIEDLYSFDNTRLKEFTFRDFAVLPDLDAAGGSKTTTATEVTADGRTRRRSFGTMRALSPEEASQPQTWQLEGLRMLAMENRLLRKNNESLKRECQDLAHCVSRTSSPAPCRDTAANTEYN